MSIRDAKLLFSSSQTFCATAAITQAVSTNIIDLGAEQLQIGSGTPLYLNVMLENDHATNNVGQTGYIDFKLDHDTGSTFVDTGPALIMKRVNIDRLVEISQSDGVVLQVALPGKSKRYLRMVYTRGLDASTAFTSPLHINSWLGAAVPETNVGTGPNDI